MEHNPLVSIVIPVYNGANYIKEAIDSALCQNYKNIEIIVVNDGSTDGGETERVVKSYGSRIIYFSKPNGGVSSALNYGIQKMNGSYFSWLSHDDRYYPNKISDQVDLLNKYGDTSAIVFTENDQIDKESKHLNNSSNKCRIPTNQIIPWDYALEILILRGSLYGCSLLIPKEVFTQCGLFDEGLRYSQDYLMWLKMFLNEYSLIYNKKVGTSIRIHNGQLTQNGKSIYEHDIAIVANQVLPLMRQKSSRKHNFPLLFAKDNAIHGNIVVTKRCLEYDLYGNAFNHFNVYCILAYGRWIRPVVKRIYYRLFKKI